MPVAPADADRLKTLTLAQLDVLARDLNQPEEVQELAMSARRTLREAKLREAVADFRAATPIFADLTQQLLRIVDVARKPGMGQRPTDTVGAINHVLRQVGEMMATVAEVEVELPPRAAEGPGGVALTTETDADRAPAASATPASPPPPGTATNSKRFADLAAEYEATFDACRIDPTKATKIDRLAEMMLANRQQYDAVQQRLSVPWFVVGLIHCMESGFNFGRHLHNGDLLAHRTTRVPAGRPPVEVADPPFAWTTSAIDALSFMNLHKVTEWTLPRILYELERYNGFGYRFRGLATPYLWSFSDRCGRGRFIKDGVFDPDAESKQSGAATLLKRMIERQQIRL